MNIDEIYRKCLLSEEAEIEVNSWEVNIDSFSNVKIPAGTLVILVGENGRKRRADLGVLSFLYNSCDDKQFVKDFLDLNISLEEIYKRYKVLNEVERLVYCKSLEGLDEDLIALVNKIKPKVLSRTKE